ncbi:hypothetical protein AVEN_166272-1 [Araneus ventricosus]|uniref:Uncharacterized protein n=1 Tax=Araneus ventricosus TaxID=182803 RepID=A0A4Y2M939_ARAVE|nr:hypothetical protein AVEN_166272-1 [Araneus ventricosus]
MQAASLTVRCALRSIRKETERSARRSLWYPWVRAGITAFLYTEIYYAGQCKLHFAGHRIFCSGWRFRYPKNFKISKELDMFSSSVIGEKSKNTFKCTNSFLPLLDDLCPSKTGF